MIYWCMQHGAWAVSLENVVHYFATIYQAEAFALQHGLAH